MMQSDVAIDRQFLLGFRLDQKAVKGKPAVGECAGLKKGEKPFTASASESIGLKKGSKPDRLVMTQRVGLKKGTKPIAPR